MERTEYTLVGVIVVTNLFGSRGFARLIIEADEEGFREIEKNPRQDYLCYGGITVDYVQFHVFRRRIIEDDNIKVIIEEKNPIKVIEEGDYNLTADEEDHLFLLEPATIKY